jgi:hypothetical protein
LLLTVFNVSTTFIYATEWLSIPDTRLTWDISLDLAPSLAQAQDGRIWIVWHSYEGKPPKADILYKVYNGSSTFPWSPIKKLTTDIGDDLNPSITTTVDGDIWVVWYSKRDGNSEIYYKIHNGTYWSPDARLTTDPNEDEFPSVMEDKDGYIWVVWSSNRTGKYTIQYQIYNGSSWQPCGQLTSSEESDRNPSIMQAQDGKIWMVWEREEDLFYKVFFKNMTIFLPDTPLTENGGSIIDWHPSIMQAQDSRIWVAWEVRLDEQVDIYCKIYNGSWSEEKITSDPANDRMPTIIQTTDGTIWIAWTSTRDDNFDIYYKTDSQPQHPHDIAIFSVTHNPNRTYAYQDVNIYIEVVPQNQGVGSEFIQVNCYANSTLIGSKTVHLIAGQLFPLDFTWNTLNVIPGTYTIMANASIVGETDADPADNTFIDGKVNVKIPGDVDGDGVVDACDLFDLGKAYGSELGDFNWNSDCDFNIDNKVDTSDLLDLSENHGETI